MDGPSTDTAMFAVVNTNIGQHYNAETGHFICEYPGIYVFSLTILKQSGVIYAKCQIRKNQSQIAQALSYPEGVSEGFYSSSVSVVIYLVHGDTVDVHCPSGLGSIHPDYTSFSGFLNKGD